MSKRIITLSVVIVLIVIVTISFVYFGNRFFYSPSIINSNTKATPSQATPENFTVAFIGDQEYGDKSQAVLQLIKNEGTDMVLHQGDFDYGDDPDKWDQQINNILGADFPYFASVGNHDVKAWSGYQQKLIARLERIEGEDCSGDIGVNSSCTYQGLFFVLSGIGTLGDNHLPYLDNSLATSDAIWKICSWHKNQRLMQTGAKSDKVGWDAYDTCREYGAIIATGHEHAYSRTYLMSDFEQQSIANTSTTLEIKPGQTFAFVSGIAGHSVRVPDGELASNPWWASVYTQNENANFGALFCRFNEDGVPRQASCYFKDIDGNIPDTFKIISN